MSVTAIIVTRGDHDLTSIYDSIPKDWELLVWDNGARVVHGRPRTATIAMTQDFSVYGRYAAIEYASNELIYVQDDDCIISDPQAIVDEWNRIDEFRHVQGKELEWVKYADYVVCNQPQEFRHGFYEEHSLVGFGAAFHRDAPERAFDIFEQGCGVTTYLAEEPEFKRERQGGIIVQSNSPHMKYVAGRGWLTVADFQRTCDVVFTALTPRVLVDIPYKNLPWAEDASRMYRQAGHQAERGKMLELAFRARDAMEE